MKNRRPLLILMGVLGIVLAFVNYDVMEFSWLLMAVAVVPGIAGLVAERMLMPAGDRGQQSGQKAAGYTASGHYREDDRPFWDRFEERTGIFRFLECVGSHYILIVLVQPLFAFVPKLWTAPFPFVQGFIRFFYAFGIAYIVGYMIDRALGLVMMGSSGQMNDSEFLKRMMKSSEQIAEQTEKVEDGDQAEQTEKVEDGEQAEQAEKDENREQSRDQAELTESRKWNREQGEKTENRGQIEDDSPRTAGIFLPLPGGFETLAFVIYNVFFLGIYCIMQFSRTRAYDIIPAAGDIWSVALGMSVAFSVFLFGVNYRSMKNRILANALIPITILVFISYYIFQFQTTSIPYILAIGAIGLSERGLVKNSLLVSIYTLSASFLLSMSGVIENTISRAADGFKHTYGFGNPNWISIQLAGIVIMYLFLRNREKILGMVLDLGIIGAVIYFIRYSTGGRTSVTGLAVVLAATVVCDLCHLIPYNIRQKFTKAVAIFNFIVTEAILFGSAAMAMYLSWTYDEDNESRVLHYVGKVFDTRSFEARLESAHRGLLNYTPTMFGQFIREINNAEAAETGEKFFWLDVYYVRLLLMYGIVMFVAFFLFYTILNYRLAKKGRFYQMYLLTALPVMGVTEALVGDLMYNIFPVVAFSKIQEESDYEKRKEGDFFGVSLAPPIALLALTPALLYVLSFLRTIVNGFGISEANAFYMVSGILLTALFIIASTSKAIVDSFREKKVTLGRAMSVCRAAMILGIGVIAGGLVMENLREMSINRMSEAEAIIKAISDASIGDTYVDNVPDVYDKEYTGISKPFFYGDELSFYENVSLITDIDHDYDAYFKRGFVYTPITDYDALYTNDAQVIEAMEKRGCTFNGFCSYERHVNLPYEIVRNDLGESRYGGALLNGPSQSLTQGPYSVTNSGTYTVTYELYIDPLEYEEDYKVCTLTALGNYGEKILNKKEVLRSEFDEEGHLSAAMNFNGSGKGTEFHAVMEEGQKMEVRDIVFAKSGASDKRIVTDARGNVIHEEYLDAEGKPQMQSGGYYGIDNEYDEQDRLVHRTYLGEDGQPVMRREGYAQQYIEYGKKNSYRIYTYFDTDGNPVLIKKGYHKDYVEYDDKGRNVRETYYGIEGVPVLTSDGYAGILRDYDNEDNVVSLIYLGADLEPTVINNGYAQIKRAFNDKKQIVREEYYDENGNRTTLSGGQSAVEREYDDLGCAAVECYFGINDERILKNNKYYKLVRRYNEKKQSIHEEYYDVDENPVAINDGYAGVDKQYDNNGNVIKYTYLGTDFKPVLLNSGYSILRRSYNEKGQYVREEYYDIEDKAIELSEGQHAVEYGYDENGNNNSRSYYNLLKEPVLFKGSYFKDCRYYDDKKQLIRREFYGIDEQPILIGKGYFAIEYSYDENGVWVERKYYDISGNMVTMETNEK
ncbi:MAG: oligosaccharide repeat unit polymerase [Butyrivibrio sp.]|nr:oligosaccharide repeat unit polymerase [Butyrivibrio sp.]